MRGLFAATAAILATSTMAFMPTMKMETTPFQAGVKTMQKLALGGSALFGFYAGPTMVPPAHADGAVSAATVTRAGALYGPRVIGLKSAVEKGDFAVLEAELGAAKLFNSGAFAMNTPLKKKVQASFADVEKAIKAKDAGALKTAWAKYYDVAGLKNTNPFSTKDRGQALSSDFSYAAKNTNFVSNVIAPIK